MRRMATFALAVLAAACSATIGVDDRVPLEFEWDRENTAEYRPQPIVTAAGGEGQIVVDARLSASSPCEKLTAAAGRDGARTVELEVRIVPDAPVCLAVIDNYAYTARVLGLEPGAWTVRVRHLYPGTGWPSGTVLETPVTVR